MSEITYTQELSQINWNQLKSTLSQDNFDNGRNSEQLKQSLENSYAVCLALAQNTIIGTARALSDGVCNAYIVDVWTLSPFRRQGIATQMMQNLLSRLAGQHVYLFTDNAAEFYAQLGFHQQSVGMGQVVGNWLVASEQQVD